MDLELNPYAPPHARPDHQAEVVPRQNYPWWVKMSLWGVPGRSGLQAFVVLSLILAGGCMVYGIPDRRFVFVGAAFLLSALWYWLSIRWIDRHGSWAA